MEFVIKSNQMPFLNYPLVSQYFHRTTSFAPTSESEFDCIIRFSSARAPYFLGEGRAFATMLAAIFEDTNSELKKESVCGGEKSLAL